MSTNVAAIKAKMGDWTYYITKMKFGEVASQVKLAEEIHKNKDLDELIQRDLSDRVEAMTAFLLEEPQRFYGSLVVAIYKGNPVFHPIKIAEGNKIVDSTDHSFGLLQMDGSQTYFALDGQHRLSSIKAACEQNPDLKSEEISVLVIKHDESIDGLIRTRRLFTKLNRYAKATDHKTNIALDEDDCIAIATRRLVREFGFFKGTIKIDAKGKQLAVGKADDKYITTLAMLYECNKELACGFSFNGSKVALTKEFLSKRPDDALLDGLFEFLENVWSTLFNKIPQLKGVGSGTQTPGKLRNESNSTWMKPVSQLILCKVLRNGLINDISVDESVKKIAKVPLALTGEPWANVIYDVNLATIKSGSGHSDFLVDLLSHSIGIPNSISKKELKKKYGEYYGKTTKEVPDYSA
jgi:DNA sulfur modification protein DndB